MTSEAFAASAKEQEVLAFRLLRVGEYVRDLPKATRARHREIEWRKVVDLRNLIAHDYEWVDPGRVRTAAATELDHLAVACHAIIAESGKQ